jgi:pimeloyl-ACP methyl ester carboxylesterase
VLWILNRVPSPLSGNFFCEGPRRQRDRTHPVALSESFVTRVVSRDGTEIAYWTSGDGPPLVLVHGAPADHTRWRPLLPYLESHATVHAMDRRGRGASGDAPDYHLAREFEDVAAVVDAVAEASRSAVDVYGHSFGLEGQEHVADILVPEVVADEVARFLSE